MIRKIHLDFHTHPDTAGIGRDFDPDRFADTLAAAHVNYLATPGKCHFGNIYYSSRVGRSHPHLADPEMFPKTVAACGKRGIQVQAYWTLGLDAYAAVQHPDWRQRYTDGKYGNWGHYLHMCFASPYIDKMVIPEILECIDRCPGLAGFWFDIALYVDGAFYSTGFEEAAVQRLGNRAADVSARWSLARQIIRERCIQLDQAIKARLPNAENYFNSLVVPGEPENIPLQPLQEVENPILFGGPEKMSSNIRWLRGRKAETIGLVSRFQGPWSDPGTLRTTDQMRFDVARTVAMGCQISMGDHRYPDGHLEPEVYRRLAPIYADVVALQPWLDQASFTPEAIVLEPVVTGSGKGFIFPDLGPRAGQDARLLEEVGLQFDVCSSHDVLPTLDSGLVIWPGDEPGSPELMAQLEHHVARGGSLLAMNTALDSPGAAALFGVRARPWTPPAAEGGPVTDMSSIGHVGGGTGSGTACGPLDQFVRLRPDFGGEAFSQILNRPTRLIEAEPCTTVLADRFEPVSAKPPFPSEKPAGPMIVQKGRVIYCAADLFAESAEGGSPSPQHIIAALCARLLSRFRVRHDGGSSVAAHLNRVPQGYALHLVHWSLDRWGKQVNTAATFPRLGPIRVELHLDKPVKQVTLEPGGASIPFHMKDGVCTFTVPSLYIWQVVGLHV